MARIYLSLRDPERIAHRAELTRRMHALPGADGSGPMSPEDYATLQALATEWAAERDTVQDAPCALGCGRTHDAVWTIARVVADTLGPWNVYRVNGEGHTLPGGGLPMTLDKLPRDARRLDAAAAAAFWHAE